MEPSEQDLDVLRIAIALLPWPQGVESVEEAVASLKEMFPVPNEQPEEGWKQRALRLGTEMRRMQDDLDSKQIELLRLRSEQLTTTQNASSELDATKKRSAPADSAPEPKKKKRKVVPQQATTPMLPLLGVSKLQEILTKPSSESPTTLLKISSCVLSSLRDLHSLSISPPTDADLTYRCVERVMKGFGDILSSLLSARDGERDTAEEGLPLHSSVHPDLLKVIGGLLPDVLHRAESLVPSSVNDILDVTSRSIITPLVKSIHSLSSRSLKDILSKPSTRQPLLDLRSGVTDFLESLMICSGMGSLAHDGICQMIALDSVSELEKLWEDPTTTVDEEAASDMRTKRIERLARKEALPRLCGILRLALSSQPFETDCRDSSISLAPTVFARLSALYSAVLGPQDAEHPESTPDSAQTSRKRHILGALAEEALLSVIEYAWMRCPVASDEQVDGDDELTS